MSARIVGNGWYVNWQDDGDHGDGHIELCKDQGGDLYCDSEGIVTHSPLWPEPAEIIYGGIAALIIFFLLFKFAGPPIKKAMAARTERIQKELDESAQATADAATESARIRQALGDISAERERMLDDAQRQAAQVLEEGRARLRQELLDNEARAVADIAAARSRAGAELRAEIARLSSAATEQVVHGAIDGATHQQLIEAFIARVGSGQGVSA